MFRLAILSAAISIANANVNRFDTVDLPKHLQPRLPPLARDDLETPEHVAVFDSIVSSKRGVTPMSNGALPGPFNLWMYLSEEVAAAEAQLGSALRFKITSIPEKLVEIAILTVGTYFRCSVEVWAHTKIAKKKGVKKDIIDAILHSKETLAIYDVKDAKKLNDVYGESLLDQEAVYKFTREILQKNRVSDETYNAAKDAVRGSNRAMAELAAVIGHYSSLAMQMNIARVPAPGSVQPFPYKEVNSLPSGRWIFASPLPNGHWQIAPKPLPNGDWIIETVGRKEASKEEF
eukprot:g3379.t1